MKRIENTVYITSKNTLTKQMSGKRSVNSKNSYKIME